MEPGNGVGKRRDARFHKAVGVFNRGQFSPTFRLHILGSAALSTPHGENFMSQHRSLRSSGAIAAKRNVLKRFERVELLKKRGQWKDGDRVLGLRKTKPEA